MGSPSKKRHHEAPSDPDRTPKAKKSTHDSDNDSASQQSSNTGKSGASPRKQLAHLRLTTYPIRQLKFSSPGMPQSLETFEDAITKFELGKNIIALSIKNDIDALSESNDHNRKLLRNIIPEFFDANDARDKLGRTPSPAKVLGVVKAAAKCDINGHPEANWNMMVHYTLLSLALDDEEDNDGDGISTVEICPVTTAKILSDFKIPGVPLRQIDFCVAIRPNQQDSAIVKECCKLTIDNSINHTSFQPLLDKPIGLSLETKTPGAQWDQAVLQVSVWQAAQWRFLVYLARTCGYNADNYEDIVALLPPFLPGIIIQGHDWNFVATTYDGKETTIWTTFRIGSTENALGVYRIICVLQYIRQWILTVYWTRLMTIMRGPQTDPAV